MNNLENKTNAELIEIFDNEIVYLKNRASGVISRLVKKFKKSKNYEKVWVENSIITHEKNEFLGIYFITCKSGKVDCKACFFGIRYVRGMRQFFYLDDHDGGNNRDLPIKPNSLTLINQHVIDRYITRCKLDMSEEDVIIQFFKRIDDSATRVSYTDDTIEVSIKEGIILGDIKKDGTMIYKTFVNKLYENQRMHKYSLDKFNENYRRDKESKVV